MRASTGACQCLGPTQRLLKRLALQGVARVCLHHIHDPLAQLAGVIRAMLARARVDCEIEQLGDRLRFNNPVGDLALQRHRLEIAGGLIEHKRRIDRRYRHQRDRGAGPPVPKCPPRTLAGELAVGVGQNVFGRLGFEVGDWKHGRTFRGAYNVSMTLIIVS
jgi:hypothetical protein